MQHKQSVFDIDFSLFAIFSVAHALRFIMDFTLFTLTLMCTIVIALSLFVVELNGLFSMEAMIALLNLLLVLVLTFTHCYLSEWVTSDLLEMGDVFYNLAWYRLLVKHQRLTILPIQQANDEFRLRGMGIFDCSLAAYTSVRKTFFVLFLFYWDEKYGFCLPFVNCCLHLFALVKGGRHSFETS